MGIAIKEGLGFGKKYVYLVALTISLIVVLQVSNNREGKLYIFLSDIVYYFSNYFVWAFLIEYINGIIQPKNFKNRLLGIVLFVIGILSLALVQLVFTNIIYYGFRVLTTQESVTDAFYDFKPIIFKSFLSRFLDITIIIISLRILDTYQKLQYKKLQVLSLEKDLNQSQLFALQSQLNPHFLFNSLHTLNTLIGYDDEKARSMVMKITKLLRKILSHKETPDISFKEELEYFENYLDIEQERFNDRLDVVIDVDENTKEIRVPTLVLQPLIENAFKHGVSLEGGKTMIQLIAKVKEKDFYISLKNSIPEEKKQRLETSTKIGLKNLKQRLEVMYAGNFDFKTTIIENMFVVSIIIKEVG